MTSNHKILVKQIIDEVQVLPENLKREVLDFIGYLRTKYDQEDTEAHDDILLATFGSWEDDREPEEIVQDIYANRTTSNNTRHYQRVPDLELENWVIET